MLLRKPSIATLLLAVLLPAKTALAGLILDQNLFYSSTATKTSFNESQSRYALSLFIGASIPKQYFIGWKTTLYQDSMKDSVGTAKISGLEMGPRFGLFIDRNRWWAFTTTYLPVHGGTYTSDTGTVSTLSGSGFEFELCFAPQVFKNLYPGVSMLYHLGSYSTSTNTSSTASTVSYSRNAFTPSIYLHWVFGGLD